MRTLKDVVSWLAIAAIIFFLIGFCVTAVVLIRVLIPASSEDQMSAMLGFQYLLGIILFEAISALPCTVISFVIAMVSDSDS